MSKNSRWSAKIVAATVCGGITLGVLASTHLCFPSHPSLSISMPSCQTQALMVEHVHTVASTLGFVLQVS